MFFRRLPHMTEYRGEEARGTEVNFGTKWFQVRFIIPAVGISVWGFGKWEKWRQLFRHNYPDMNEW